MNNTIYGTLLMEYSRHLDDLINELNEILSDEYACVVERIYIGNPYNLQPDPEKIDDWKDILTDRKIILNPLRELATSLATDGGTIRDSEPYD